jgi:organic hydroperoxide reductase OsmC/OhrA
MAESPPVVTLRQQEKYRYAVEFDGPPVGGTIVDEAPPTGGGAGPNPGQSLALAVGHCMSSTLYACFERAHVAVRPIVTTVRPIFGRNARGRLRVVRLEVALRAEPVDPTEQAKVDHCLEIFADYCPVSGAVRDGAEIVLTTAKSADPAGM